MEIIRNVRTSESLAALALSYDHGSPEPITECLTHYHEPIDAPIRNINISYHPQAHLRGVPSYESG